MDLLKGGLKAFDFTLAFHLRPSMTTLRIHFCRVERGLIFNEQEWGECGRVCLLSWGWDHYRDKAWQGYDRDLPEGRDAVGSLGFLGILRHTYAQMDTRPQHSCKRAFVNLPGKMNAKRCVLGCLTMQVSICLIWTHTRLHQSIHTSIITILFATGIFTA